MPPVAPITNENTFPDKSGTRPVPTGKNPANFIRGVDLNALKARLADHATLLNALEELLGEGGDGIPAMDPVPAVGQLLAAGAGGTVVDAGATVAAFTASFMALTATLDTKVPLHPIAGDGAITSDYTILAADAGKLRTITPAADPIAISIDEGLWETGGPGRAFSVRFRIGGAAHPITFLGTNGIVITYHGKDPGTTPLAVGDLVHVLVVSATEAHVIVTPAGEVASAAALAAVSSVASGALPKPGGTTAAGGIVTGSGTAGAAVAVSSTTVADLVKRLGNVFTLNANTVLDDSYSGSVIFTDTSGGARQHTIPHTVSAGWNAVFVREGANTLSIVGSGGMNMQGPAAAANAVAIAVDNGGVSVLRRSATKCWCAGKIS